MRPCDGIETAECYEVALESLNTPTVLALSRHNLPTVRQIHNAENLSAKGAYVLSDSKGQRQVSLLATGSEVTLALAAQKILHDQGIAAAVISMPCWELFDRQPEAYRRSVLGESVVRVAIEAGATFGWEKYVGENGAVVGMQSFGASGPAERLYDHFNITPQAVADLVKARLS